MVAVSTSMAPTWIDRNRDKLQAGALGIGTASSLAFLGLFIGLGLSAFSGVHIDFNLGYGISLGATAVTAIASVVAYRCLLTKDQADAGY